MTVIAPGPTGHPVGDQLRPFAADPLAFLTEAHRAFGDVVRLRLWPHLVHLLSRPDDIRRVLVTHASNYHDTVVEGLGSIAPAAFRGRAIDATSADIVDAVTAVLSQWDQRAQSTGTVELDLAREMRVLTLDVLGRSMCRGDMTCDLRDLEPALECVSRVTAPHRSLSSLQRLERGRDGFDDSARAAVAALTARLDELVARRRRLGLDDDLLSQLIARAPSDQLMPTLMALLIAGHESAASAITWTLLLLADRPRERDVVVREVDRELSDGPPGHDELARLHETRVAVQETMRLFPPVWLLAPRLAHDDDEIGGFVIPAGSLVLISPFVTHRDPTRWDRPDTFIPSRARDDAGLGYLPFGAGPWGCIGSQFGMTEARVVVAMVLRRFECERRADTPLVPDPRSALWPVDARVRLRPRPPTRQRPRPPTT